MVGTDPRYDAYRHGDFSQAYPLMRGSAPLLVALITVALGLDVLPLAGYGGIALISLGLFALVDWKAGRPVLLLFALGAGAALAVATLIDGTAVRGYSDPFTYVVWLEVFEHIALPAYALVFRRPQFVGVLRGQWKIAGIGAQPDRIVRADDFRDEPRSDRAARRVARDERHLRGVDRLFHPEGAIRPATHRGDGDGAGRHRGIAAFARHGLLNDRGNPRLHYYPSSRTSPIATAATAPAASTASPAITAMWSIASRALMAAVLALFSMCAPFADCVDPLRRAGAGACAGCQ
jgi:hypothetical protein